MAIGIHCWLINKTTSLSLPQHLKQPLAFTNSIENFVCWSSYLRNVCAHHTRLWNHEMQIQPMIPRSTHHPFLSQTNYVSPETGQTLPLNNKTYFFLSMVIYLMNYINPKHSIQSKFKALLAKYPNIDIQAMGFPTTWQNEPLWK